MAQDYSGQLDKSNKAITAPKLPLHNLECWQINLHRCTAKQQAITCVKLQKAYVPS